MLSVVQCGFFKRTKVLNDGPKYKVTLQKQTSSGDSSDDVTPVNGRYENLQSGNHHIAPPDVQPGNSLDNPYRRDTAVTSSQLAERYESQQVAQQYEPGAAASAADDQAVYDDTVVPAVHVTAPTPAPATGVQFNTNTLGRYDNVSTPAPFRYAHIPIDTR